MIKSTRILLSFFLCLWLKSTFAADLTCEYKEVSNTELLNIAGPQYACNLKGDFPHPIMAVDNVLGEPIEGKSDNDVTLFTVDNKKIYVIPNLKENFPGLIYIKIIKTPLRILTKSNLDPYKESLKHLVIRESQLEILPKDLFDGFTNLETLDLRNNKIFYIGESVFETLSSLTYLMLSGNQCKDRTSLADVGDYTRISLSFTVLMDNIAESTCKFSDFDQLLSIYQETTFKLDIDVYNAPGFMMVLAEQLMDTMEQQDIAIGVAEKAKQEIQDLYVVATESVLLLTEEVANLTTSIEECEANSTQLEAESAELRSKTDELNTKLQELELTAEKCMEVNGTCRYITGDSGYTCVAHNITVTAQGIEIVWTGTHINATLTNRNIETFIIRNLDVQFIPSKIGDAFIKLRNFIIKSSKLSKLSTGDFFNMNDVETIEITLNEITSVDAGAFDGLPLLKSLDLSENKIKSLPSKIFAQLSAIKSINLNKNLLTSIKADFIPTTNSIEFFSATDNQLAKVESSFVWRLRSATFIDFTGNGCNLKFDVAIGSYINFYSSILSKC